MARLADDSLATLLLTSRLVDSAAPVLKASDYWALAARVDLAGLLGADETPLVADFGEQMAARVVALLDRAGALAFALEELEQQGVRAIAATDPEYPPRWRSRLGTAAPPHLHLAGSTALLAEPAVGIVGSRDLAPAAVEIAQRAARFAATQGRAVVSGGARGTDAIAMHATLDAEGHVVGILADALVRAARSSDLRNAVLDERLALATPYAPTAPFSVGNAMGRNKLIYALADVTLVVASDLDTGGTWSGAKEALAKGYGPVAVWRGEGEGPGNARLVELGASPLRDVETMFEGSSASQTEQLDLGL
jgi:predicted Rossmann fold nucleotide-binding protein DprA/Smf involved in DNA uptake